jgi:Regulator of ribonuclease activity B
VTSLSHRLPTRGPQQLHHALEVNFRARVCWRLASSPWMRYCCGGVCAVRRPGRGPVVLLVTEVGGHLLVQRGLERPGAAARSPGGRRVLNELSKRAEDLSQPRHVVFYLYTTPEDTGHVLAAEARARGFQARVREPLPEGSASWAVVCEQHTVLTPDFVRESVDFFEALAERHQAEYDGWEAAA